MSHKNHTDVRIWRLGCQIGYENKQVTGDILHASFGDEWMGDGWSGTNDSKRLKKLLGAEAWGLAVQ